MKAARAPRPSARRRRARVLPTVARAPRPKGNTNTTDAADRSAVRALRLGDALRAGREALMDVQKQLDMLLATVRAPAGKPDADSADRLRRATKRVGTAMHRLTAV